LYPYLLDALSPTGDENQVGVFSRKYWRIFLYVGNRHALLFGLGTFMALLSILIFAFTAHQMYILANGTTSDETDRWGDVRLAIEDKVLFVIFQQQDHTGDEGLAQPTMRILDIIEVEDQEADERPRRLVQDLCEIQNIYDKGWFRNLALIFSPPEL
ncbi:hypothetical protein EV182_006252, partial [Spiromyces aspiralis]